MSVVLIWKTESLGKVVNLAIENMFPLLLGHANFTDQVNEFIYKIADMGFFLNGVCFFSHEKIKIDDWLLDELLFDQVLEILLLDNRHRFTGWEIKIMWDKYWFKLLWCGDLSLNLVDEFLFEQRGECSELDDDLRDWHE